MMAASFHATVNNLCTYGMQFASAAVVVHSASADCEAHTGRSVLDAELWVGDTL